MATVSLMTLISFSLLLAHVIMIIGQDVSSTQAVPPSYKYPKPLPDNSTNPCSPANIAANRTYFAYPSNEHEYVQCDNAENAWVKSCPSTLVWDDDGQICNYPPNK